MISFYSIALYNMHIQIICIINIIDNTSELRTDIVKTKFWRALC